MSNVVLLFYIATLAGFSFFSYFYVDHGISYLADVYGLLRVPNNLVRISIYTAFIVTFIWFYLLFLKLYDAGRLNTRDIKRAVFVSVCGLFVSYPAMLSHDIFNYMATAKVLFFYGENPYIIPPIFFSGDPYLDFLHAAGKTALYGPVWILLTGVPFFAGFSNFLATMFLFKALVIGFYLLSLFLLYKLSRSMRAVLLFGLNPLVLVETVVSGHNDIVMVGLVLLSFYLLLQKRTFFGVLFFLCSVGIKFATIVLLPVIVVLVISSVRNHQPGTKKLYRYSAIAMFLVFLLSFLREEIYPWYALWFLAFTCLLTSQRLERLVAVFSAGLLLRYVPYMIIVSHFGVTPILNAAITFIPVSILGTWYIIRDRLWSGKR